MKTINDVYEQCSVQDLVNSGYNYGTQKGEFEADLAKEESIFSDIGWEISGWVKVKEGKEIPEINGEQAGYLLKLDRGEYYGMVMVREPVVMSAEELTGYLNDKTYVVSVTGITRYGDEIQLEQELRVEMKHSSDIEQIIREALERGVLEDNPYADVAEEDLKMRTFVVGVTEITNDGDEIQLEQQLRVDMRPSSDIKKIIQKALASGEIEDNLYA